VDIGPLLEEVSRQEKSQESSPEIKYRENLSLQMTMMEP